MNLKLAVLGCLLIGTAAYPATCCKPKKSELFSTLKLAAKTAVLMSLGGLLALKATMLTENVVVDTAENLVGGLKEDSRGTAKFIASKTFYTLLGTSAMLAWALFTGKEVNASDLEAGQLTSSARTTKENPVVKTASQNTVQAQI